MRFKSLRFPIQLTVLVCLLACFPPLYQAGRLPDNPNVFAMEVDDSPGLMNGDKDEQALFKQFEERQFEKFQQEENKKKKKNEEEEELKRKQEEEEEEEKERKQLAEEKRQRELRREERMKQEEKEREEEHERRQKELRDIERKKKQKEEEEKEEKAKQQRKHNKEWRDKHEGRKKTKSKQEEWQQQQAEQAEEAKRKFEQDNFQDEVAKKKIQEVQAAELRALEPHVETHTKEEKEAIKEREENKEEHKKEVMDRLNPDAVVYDGEELVTEEKKEGKDGHEDEDEDCEDCKKEKAEKAARELKAKQAKEAEELAALEPHVETHNKADKKMEEMMKDKPFIAGDIEVAVHGAGHVHEDKPEGEKPAMDGIKGLDEVLEIGKKDEEKGEIGAEDPEHLMHGGGNHEHGTANKQKPGIAIPDDVSDHGGDFAHDDSKPAKKKEKPKDSEIRGIGIEDVEKAVHGPDQSHDHARDDRKGPAGKRITKEDIDKLGLSKDMFKGVDMTKLLAKDQRQYERFQNGEDEDDDDDDDEENKNSFWGQMSRIRKDYLDSLARRIRNIGVPDMETAEWDKNDLDDREMPTAEKTGQLKKGETTLEHQMESWSSTAGKGREHNANYRFAPKVGEIPK